jgi:hypothetical protein
VLLSDDDSWTTSSDEVIVRLIEEIDVSFYTEDSSVLRNNPPRISKRLHYGNGKKKVVEVVEWGEA